MQIRIQDSYRYIVAVCDTNLLGKKFEEGKFQLDVKESFYKGKEQNKEQVLKTMKSMSKEDATFNIVGPEAVETALKAGIITKEGVKKINKVPFALILL